MYMRMGFALAAANLAENGMGYAVKDGAGRYFCGFAQGDGSLVFRGFRQKENGDGSASIERYSQTGGELQARPVFLSLEEMEAKGFGAAAMTSRSGIFDLGIRSPELVAEGRFALVRKDLTYVPKSEPAVGDIFNMTYSMPGLASVAACRAGIDAGCIGLRQQFAESAGVAVAFVKKALGFGAPKGPG